jgi:hypothetical protein
VSAQAVCAQQADGSCLTNMPCGALPVVIDGWLVRPDKLLEAAWP